MKNSIVKLIGYVSILLAICAIITGLLVFEEQKCLDRWFIDDNNVICKDCSVYFGQECLSCNSTACETCESGYFFATQDQNYTNIDLVIEATNENRCRLCTEVFGSSCIECNQTQCTQIDETSNSFIDSDGQVAVCTKVENCADTGCSNDGCIECEEGFFVNAGACTACSDTL